MVHWFDAVWSPNVLDQTINASANNQYFASFLAL
jgi:hypothetical protein